MPPPHLSWKKQVSQKPLTLVHAHAMHTHLSCLAHPPFTLNRSYNKLSPINDNPCVERTSKPVVDSIISHHTITSSTHQHARRHAHPQHTHTPHMYTLVPHCTHTPPARDTHEPHACTHTHGRCTLTFPSTLSPLAQKQK